MAWRKPLLGVCLVLQAAPLLAAAPAREPVNPMTGVPLSYEDKQRHLEEMRLDTQLRREALNRASAESDLELVPYKKRLEETRLLNSTLQADRARIAAREAAQRVKQQAVALAAARKLPAAPTLVGVMKTGEAYLALVSYHGRTWNMHDHQRLGGVLVTDIDDTGALFNGRRYTVQPQPATVTLTDKRKPALMPPLPVPAAGNYPLPPLPAAALAAVPASSAPVAAPAVPAAAVPAPAP